MITMMLAKNADFSKLPVGDVLVEEKIDGVPGVFCADPFNYGQLLSRQGKEIVSANHIVEEIEKATLNVFVADMPPNIVGELKVPGLPFEESAGYTRAKHPCNKQLMYLFDMQEPNRPYHERAEYLNELAKWSAEHGTGCLVRPRVVADRIPINTQESRDKLMHNSLAYLNNNPNVEGLMIRPYMGLYKVGKRSWDMQRIVHTPTIDLRVCSFTEAVDKDGYPLGMVGGIIVGYNGDTIGVGPGKLSHEERKVIWDNPENYIGRIAQIKYKGGNTANYKALRQPTFQYWRFDKETPDA